MLYCATCPCNLMYIGLTSRKLKIHMRKHIIDIQKASSLSENTQIKLIPRHFKEFHGCESSALRMKGIDKITIGKCSGDSRKIMAQMQSRWIMRLNTVRPKDLSFAP